jgi:hypothetical protein
MLCEMRVIFPWGPPSACDKFHVHETRARALEWIAGARESPLQAWDCGEPRGLALRAAQNNIRGIPAALESCRVSFAARARSVPYTSAPLSLDESARMAREIAAAGAPPPSAGDAFDVPDGVVYLKCAQPGAARFGQGESAQFYLLPMALGSTSTDSCERGRMSSLRERSRGDSRPPDTRNAPVTWSG